MRDGQVALLFRYARHTTGVVASRVLGVSYKLRGCIANASAIRLALIASDSIEFYTIVRLETLFFFSFFSSFLWRVELNFRDKIGIIYGLMTKRIIIRENDVIYWVGEII